MLKNTEKKQARNAELLKSTNFEDKGNDTFERIDEKTGKVVGYAFFNVQKRKEKKPQDIEVNIPAPTIAAS